MEQDNFLNFEVDFEFWGKVNPDSLKWEYQPVGKHYIAIEKANKPIRWKTLHKNGTARPPMCKLWFENHQKYHYQLYDFDKDDVEDFEGWDLIDTPAEQDSNDMAWLFPQKGPGQFKDVNKKKKKSSSSKKKKSSGSKVK